MDRRTFLSASAAAAFGATPALSWTYGLDLNARLGANAQFLTLCDALIAADLGGLLSQSGPYTVFAPNLAAFDHVGQRELARLMTPALRPTLRRILSYHIVPGEFGAFELIGRRRSLPTLAGPMLPVDGTGGSLRVGTAFVGEAGLSATNGVIHQINRVLRPA
ncbi:Immunogenic protein MPT70 precursor [Roseivivax jejudonensis]|uniref:Immunogenic protein MPT70 n=1 Tax=Roseivivax jejudonensis TaxID=1529041 RepID=A0A1X6ZWH1_9RHOB|nr:fasciclin domain-containing protein [Roseivivax jejudonensis]SLN61660.1 Immunogenic protein MPT70 precursor [Roseivivax jejudonensis]